MSSSRNGKPVKESSGPSVPAWMLTYADTVTLLMCFFVMLMTFSTLDEDKYEKVRGALVGYLGIAGSDRISVDSLLMRRILESSRVHTDGYENPPRYDEINYLRDKFETSVRTTSFANLLNYDLTARGFEIHLLVGALFEEGSASLKPEAAQILNIVGDACRNLPHQIRVQAYPDIFSYAPGRIGSFEEIALERAAVICKHLQGQSRIDAERLSVATQMETPEALFNNGRQRQVTIAILRAPDRKHTL